MTAATQFDVLVAGAGVAGVGAAVGAARTGARVLLVGDEPGPGGVVVAGLHRSMCGLFATGREIPRGPLNDGVVQDVFEGLGRRDPACTIAKTGRVYVLPFRTEDLVETFLELLGSYATLEVRFATRVVGVQTHAGRIVSVDTEAGNASTARVECTSIVDCTGSGDAIRMAGAAREIAAPEELQLSGQSVVIEGVLDPEGMLPIRVPYELRLAAGAGELASHLRFTQYVPGRTPGSATVKLSVLPGRDLGARKAEEEAQSVVDVLRRRLEAFRDARVVARSPRVVDREGERVVGRYTLTDRDVLSARKFSDGVVKNAWPIEIWNQQAGPHYEYVPEGDHYEIPLRCLRVRDVENAWVAGRCISATHRAHASTRASGTCLAIGDQAGRHAARADS